MNNYRIFETSEFARCLKRLDTPRRSQLEKRLKEHIYPQLRGQPFFGPNIKKLRSYSPDTWRYRIGDYRLLYCVNQEEKVVVVITLDDRKDVYR